MVRALLNNPIVHEKIQDGKLVYIFDKKQHAQTLLQNLVVMQDNDEGSLTDVVITSKENEKFYFHSTILAALSKKLEEILLKQGLGSAASRNSKIVMENNFSSEAVKCLWDYAYTSVVTLTPSNINEVKEMAEHYGIDSLLQECKELLDQESFVEGHDKKEVEFKDLPELILNRLHDFLERNVLCTAALIDSFTSTRFPCHGAIIAAACTEFLFELAFGDSNVIDLNNHETSQSMGPFLHYLYSANLMIDQTTMQPLIEFAAKFNIPSLGNACCNCLKFWLAADNALGIKSIAQDLLSKGKNPIALVTDGEKGVNFYAAADDLFQYCKAFVLRNFLIITESDAFLGISLEDLIDLVVDDYLGVHSEEEVFFAIMKWVCCSPETRANDLPNLLEAVRLEYIPVDFLEAMLQHELMITDSLCIQIIEDAQTIRLPSRPRRCSIVQQYDCVAWDVESCFN